MFRSRFWPRYCLAALTSSTCEDTVSRGAPMWKCSGVIPVVMFEDLKPDIDCIAEGDTSPILCSQTISEFSTSSGTSGGEWKLIPTTEEEIQRRFLLDDLAMPLMNQFNPDLDKGKAMRFTFRKSEFKTAGGIVAQPLLTIINKRRHNKNYTSPHEAILCQDSYPSMYTQLLCGLCQNTQVVHIGSTFASSLLRAIKFLEKNWALLCRDIRMECCKESWHGIVRQLWPNTKCVDAVVTGTMSQYVPMLEYYFNGLPLVSYIYASSECYFGLNLDPLCKPSDLSYTLIPTLAYFEFLTVNRDHGFDNVVSNEPVLDHKEDQLEVVDLVDVKLG
ncbi:hypothetical protein CRG98_033187 [Punica granatum]|uniref:Uncharacterized protein n=1 Tax=Punica granatum TaxID=22663 RepID=A0A2I0IQY5_PUNGR|nr:hypothetical protein CRG98_033187 [Punica granatum]